MSRRLLYAGLFAGGSAGFLTLVLPSWQESYNTRKRLTMHAKAAEEQRDFAMRPLPTRQQQIDALKTEDYDVLVIGGGCTGAGVVLDSISRGLKSAMVEKFDFSSGTSSRSTKLIHGGVRYLQKAVFNLDFEQFRMVREALNERANLLQIAPHLTYPLPIMLPIYKWWQVPYFWAGLKAYDMVAGNKILKPSYFIPKSKALELFPMLKKEKLVGAIVYYDGAQNDARMNLSLALTSARMGANICNHLEVLSLLKTTEGDKQTLCGAHVRDRVTGEEFDIKAKCVINATGPFTDSIRNMDDPEKKKICSPSSGVHIVLPDYYSPERMGLLDPETTDGRVIFFLPWLKHTIAGTTDNKCDLSDNPSPTEAEIEFILSEIKHYLSTDVHVRRGDVLSAWAGVRPLVSDPNAKNTQSIARNHIIEVSNDNMITIAGGKWTTYRHMAEETIDKAVEVCNLRPTSKCRTEGLLLDGAHGWSPNMFIRLIQDYGLESSVAQHLSDTYGDKAFKVAKQCTLTGHRWPIVGKRLHDEFPYLEAEVIHACREYAARAVDVIARRTRLAFLNVHAAEEALPKIVEIMAKELGWDKNKQKEELDHCRRYLTLEMGLNLKKSVETVPINFTKEEINGYVKRFKSLDTANKGYITTADLKKHFKSTGEPVSEAQLRDILNEVDLNKNGMVEIGEYLQTTGQHKLSIAFKKRKDKLEVHPVARFDGRLKLVQKEARPCIEFARPMD